MKIECFLDTNILLYAAMGKQDDPLKFTIASELVATAEFGLSGQVIAEFAHNASKSKRGRAPLSPVALDNWIELLTNFQITPVDAEIVQKGILNARLHTIGYYDAAIIAAAERLGAPILYTEDLNHGQFYGSVQVINPFRPN
jgi:predicted nucleic acid-binding protein